VQNSTLIPTDEFRDNQQLGPTFECAKEKLERTMNQLDKKNFSFSRGH